MKEVNVTSMMGCRRCQNRLARSILTSDVNMCVDESPSSYRNNGSDRIC